LIENFMNLKNSAYLPVLAGAVIISFSSVLVKISNVSPTVSAFYRVFFGGIFLAIICIARNEFKLWSFKKNLLAVCCGLLFSLDLWAWHLSIMYVGPGLATILGNFQVFVLAIAGFIFFKEKLTLKFLGALPMAFAGLFLIMGKDIKHQGHHYIEGIWLGLATAVFYGFFLLLLRHIQSDTKEQSSFYDLMVLSFSSALFLGIKAFVHKESFLIPDMTTLLALGGLGLFIQCIAWVVISNALPHVKASHAGLILLLQPSLSFIWDVALFKRPTGGGVWAGVCLVLWAIYSGMSVGRHK